MCHLLARWIICSFCLALAGGCVVPTCHKRCHVSGEVLQRTGHDLGVEKAACDLIFDDWVTWTDGLSEEEAIAVGLWNNPAYQELLADLRIAEADIVEAAQLRNPQVNTLFPLGPKQWEFALLVPLDVLWLRPLRVSAADLEAHRVSERLVQDGLDVVRDIRVAYIDWQLALERARLAEQGAELRGAVARIAEARLEAGDVAELDVSAIRLDALIGISESARAAREAELALERLRYVLGLQLSDVAITAAPMSQTDAPGWDVEQLVGDAVAARPDLQAIRLGIRAAEERATLARRDIWQLTGVLPDINARGMKGFEAGPGLNFAVPLFHQNQGAIARAQAEAERMHRQFVNRRDLAAMDVRRAHIQYLQAKRDWEIWHDQILPQATQAVASSQQALQENTVSLLLVLETTRQLLNAQQREQEADAQMRRAIAELERSVGRRLIGAVPDPAGVETLPGPQVELREEKP